MKLLIPLGLAMSLCPACIIPAQQGGASGQPAAGGYGQPAGGGYGQTGATAGTAPASESAPAPAAAPAPAPAPAAPAGPTVVSVDITNRCADTVHVFYGDKPGFSSGTQSTVESNSRESKQMQAGDRVWLTDDHETGVASVTVSGNTRTIEFDCTTVTAR